MATTKPGTVKETGAKAGDVLVGVDKLNRNLRIKVNRAQPDKDGGRVVGSLQLLDAGDGPYAKALEEFVDQDFINAGEFVAEVDSKPGAQKLNLHRRHLRTWKL